MKKLLTGLISLMSISATAQGPNYDVSKDAKNGELVFNGPVTFDDLNKEPSFAWLKNGFAEYKPDEKTISYLTSSLKEYSIVIFLGTWCDDSHYLVPKLEKVLLMTGYPQGQTNMYGVDREKKTKNGEHIRYGISLVPTIILVRNNKEAGRITESAQKSIEADIAAIVEKDSKK